LFLAHHLDDQAETLLHRIDRGTGPDGLAGMEAFTIRRGVGLVRPLLAWPKKALEAVAAASGVPVTQDPSNADLRYERARLRLVSGALAELGVTPDRLGRLARAMSGARAQMDRMTGGLVGGEVILHPEGYAALPRSLLSKVPDPVAGRVLSGLIQAVGGSDYPPAPAAVARLLQWLRAEGGAFLPGETDPKNIDPENTDPRAKKVRAPARTLGGCRMVMEYGCVLIHREWRGRERWGKTRPFWVRPGVTALWDGRFEVENRTALPVAVRCAGEAGLAAWRRSIPAESRNKNVEKSVPGAVRLALPMIVDLDGALALPHLSDVGADPHGWIGSHVRVRHAPRVVPGWLKSRYRNLSGDRGSVSPPVNGRQAL
jgi:tRNA(Ile)-lysidine synthase